jgi:hypothetical protein
MDTLDFNLTIYLRKTSSDSPKPSQSVGVTVVAFIITWYVM